MERSLQKRRKIGLLFLLGVGIPSLLLGSLAFRGIRNEIALEDQRRMGEHREVSRLVAELLEAEFSSLEEGVRRSVIDLDSVFPGDFERRMGELLDEYPLIEAVFRYGGPEPARVVTPDLLYFADGWSPAPGVTSWPSAAFEHFQNARRLEFQERNHAASEAAYGHTLALVTDSVLRGEVLLAIGRVQRKAGRLQAAFATCSILAGDYADVRTSQGSAVGPAARLEQASLLLSLGDTAGAASAFLDLYEGLVDKRWALERGQYDFLSAQAAQGLQSRFEATPELTRLEEIQGTFSDLLAQEARERGDTERLLLFLQAAARRIGRVNSRNVEARALVERRITLEDQGETFLTLLPIQPGAGEDGWGILLNSRALASFLGRAIQDHLEPATGEWIVKRRDGETLLASPDSVSGPLTINATFADNFPPWLVEFYQKPQSRLKFLFASSQSIYLYMFLLIASILAFGLVLTVRAMTHELELARMKSDFVSTVSHEFKSPLTSIRHMAEMLQAGSVPSEERRQRYYDVLVEQSNRLSSLVTNILDLARIEEGRKDFQFEPADLGNLVRELVETTQHRVGHEGFRVEARIEDYLPLVRADSTAINQAVSNLLENAIRYSGEARHVAVRVSSREGTVTVEVEDHGVGISSDETEKIFDRFYRVGDPLTRSVKGSGLGLTLVKEILEAHGGQIRVESSPGKGSTFFMDLPVYPERDHGQDPDH